MKETTIFIATPDSNSKMFKQCVGALKKYTELDYELVIIDNNYDKDFNHSKEINRVINFANTKYVALLDDDTVVSKGWLKNLISAINETKSVICGCKHINKKGEIIHSGGCVLKNGKSAHYICDFKRNAFFPYVCSAVMLIDIKKAKKYRIAFDENLKKYYNDADFCLQAWEKGLKVCSSYLARVFHLEGGRKRDMPDKGDNDYYYFAGKWVYTERLSRLRRRIDRFLDYGKIKEVDLYSELLEEYSYASVSRDLKAFKQVYKRALKILKNGLGKNIVYGAAYHIGDIYFKARNYNEAKKWIEKCLNINSRHKKALKLLKRMERR